MDYHEYRNIRKTLSKSITEHKKYGLVSEGIQQLLKMLEDSSNNNIRWHIWLDLSAQASRISREDLALTFLRQRCEEFSSNPIAYASLASHLGILKEDNSSYKEESIKLAKIAFQMSLQQSRMVRYCGTNLAKVALNVDDYLCLHYAISELIRISKNIYEEDNDYEFDFIDNIDTNRFDKELLERYKKLKI